MTTYHEDMLPAFRALWNVEYDVPLFEFHPRVFEHPYTPYYDAYKGHAFRVVGEIEDEHANLECVSDRSVKVNGRVEVDDLVAI